MEHDAEPTSRTDPILRLITEYFFTSDLMHEQVHKRREKFFALRESGKGQGHSRLEHEFKCYINLWLSTLWVVAHALRHMLNEGTDELNALIDKHFGALSAFRNATFHYQRNPDKHIQFFTGKMNWAEELHYAISVYLTDYANRRAEPYRRQIK